MHCAMYSGLYPIMHCVYKANAKPGNTVHSPGGLYNFKCILKTCAPLAQLVEHSAVNRKVDGSNPSGSVYLFSFYFIPSNFLSLSSVFKKKQTLLFLFF
jgi:hypothetical protein